MQALKNLGSQKTATLAFKPHPAQEEIAEALLDHKYVVVRAGRRMGKSSLALNIVLKEALHNPGRYWIVAPEYRQAKTIYWRGLVSEYVPKNMIVKQSDQELILEIMTAVPGKTSIIEFKGSDREDSLRGVGLNGVVMDEYAFQQPYVWDKIISPMLVQTDGWALFITTPNGVANHFKPFWDNAVSLEAAGSKDWATFHFTSYDYRGPKWEKMHENLDAERLRLTPEFFAQEYMADFAKFTGIIFTEFDDKRHIQDFEIDENWTFYRSIDFGATDPTAVSFIGVNRDGKVHLFDEIYVADLRTSQIAELIKDKSAHRYFTATYGDSAAKQSILDLAQYGITSIPVKKTADAGQRNWIVSGIDRIQQALKDEQIVIHPRCKAAIKEFMSYSWRKDRLGDPVNLPEDKNNHMIDNIRYFYAMYQSGSQELEKFNYLGGNMADPTTGY